jgi:hypothetical protein
MMNVHKFPTSILSSVPPKPLFWFRSETETQIGIKKPKMLNLFFLKVALHITLPYTEYEWKKKRASSNSTSQHC